MDPSGGAPVLSANRGRMVRSGATVAIEKARAWARALIGSRWTGGSQLPYLTGQPYDLVSALATVSPLRVEVTAAAT